MNAYLLSSLEKVFPTWMTGSVETTVYSVLQKEGLHLQLALFDEVGGEVTVSLDSPIADKLTLRRIGYVPSELPAYPEPDKHDDDYLSLEPGLFPDPLFPTSGRETLPPAEYLSFWITLPARETVAPGVYPLTVTAALGDSVVVKCAEITVYPAVLPEQELIVTQWFHADSIAELHHAEVFSEEHWRLCAEYIRVARENGINMLLTPIFTPPLDTEIGGERLTVQLVDVTREKGEWSFGFEKLGRWMHMADSLGIRRFEMAHLFTQWGAAACPKIMATVDGEYRRVFGWDTPSLSEEYRGFLAAFLPELIRYVTALGFADRVTFHLSDEPHGDEQREQYAKVRELVAPHVKGFPIMDALSDYSFYESGATDFPVPMVNGIAPFAENGVRPLWGYYCCAQHTLVPNRFFAMPMYRCRIMGVLAYLYDLDGFLHWGYNFYHTRGSKEVIDPFEVTAAGAEFPSGDSFSVYPGDGTCLESTRINVFADGLADLRALRALEQKTSREAVISLLRSLSGMDMTFENYPRNAQFLLTLRAAVNAMLAN